MATVEIGSQLGPVYVIDKRKNAENSASPISVTAWAASQSQATIDTQLATLDAVYWTATRLQNTNLNDKLYALRVGYDSAGI